MVDFDACMHKTEEIFAYMPLTLTSDAWVLKPKTCWVPERSPAWECGGNEVLTNFFSQMDKFIDQFFFFKISNVFKFT